MKDNVKTRSYKGEPFQIRWDRALRQQFEILIKAYDSELSINTAIIKLVKDAVGQFKLPGYERKMRGTITNTLESQIPTVTDHSIRLSKNTIDKAVE